MSTFEWITSGTIGLVVAVLVLWLRNHFSFSSREYRKLRKDMKGGWLS